MSTRPRVHVSVTPPSPEYCFHAPLIALLPPAHSLPSCTACKCVCPCPCPCPCPCVCPCVHRPSTHPDPSTPLRRCVVEAKFVVVCRRVVVFCVGWYPRKLSLSLVVGRSFVRLLLLDVKVPTVTISLYYYNASVVCVAVGVGWFAQSVRSFCWW